MFLIVFNTRLIFFFRGFILIYLSWFNLNFIISFFNYSNFFHFTFLVDYVSLQFFSVLSIIVASVLIFSLFYMRDEIIRYNRFIWIVFLFVGSMVFLIFRGDWLILILGWDWLGVSSFFLVAFYKRDSSWRGSLKTYFTNRLGDGFFLLILSFLLIKNSLLSSFSNLIIIMIIILLCQTKRAQMPFRAWLPAAMAAPTPVSALVHSSTLVTAGIFILIRLIDSLNIFYFYIQFIGLLTLFIGSISACGSYDMKKVVAFSTLSHLGFMVVCVSSGMRLLAFFHLIVHASFKALLFICVGSLIVLNNHCQDLRQISFSLNNVFFIWGAIVRVLRLCGFPFFSGFFSKDFVIEFYFWNYNIFFFFTFLLSLAFSVMYSFRLIKSFLKINWLSNKSLTKNFYSFYIVPLLIFSLVSGVSKSLYCLSFYNVRGTKILKVFIYFFLVVGLFFNLSIYIGFLRSSIRTLDSGGPLLVYKSHVFKNLHLTVDLGVLPYIREYYLDKIYSSQITFWNKIGENLFYFSFLFLLLFLFW